MSNSFIEYFKKYNQLDQYTYIENLSDLPENVRYNFVILESLFSTDGLSKFDRDWNTMWKEFAARVNRIKDQGISSKRHDKPKPVGSEDLTQLLKEFDDLTKNNTYGNPESAKSKRYIQETKAKKFMKGIDGLAKGDHRDNPNKPQSNVSKGGVWDSVIGTSNPFSQGGYGASNPFSQGGYGASNPVSKGGDIFAQRKNIGNMF